MHTFAVSSVSKSNLIYIQTSQGAAFEAERVFLAAIDKFDAMLLKGNVYAPDGIMSINF